MGVSKRVALVRQRLAQGGEVARAALRELFPESIWLQANPVRRHFYACFEDGVGAALFDLKPDLS
jgi:hypothetical protein